MKLLRKALITLGAAAIGSASAGAQDYAWPANYEGVMLQGFYWDSYSDTKWTNLESQADELSEYFKLIWVPNSARSSGMGYLPVYWFTNHNSRFGTEEQLHSMIETFKTKGTGFIADVVVNHRVGTSSWTNFPREEWNGRTWFIGLDGICSTDEVANQPGQPKPTGAPDTGDDFDGGRDLDHTNANVQDNVKNYCLCLLEKYGYVGFRYDMVKGYGGQYTKIYNEYAKPTYSVGEYWDSNYANVTRWIDATGKQSAAFDFPGKYKLNSAFKGGNMTILAESVNGSKQPAGLIKGDYRRYAVTFVDNHDTYRDGNKFNGNVPAANAFILCSPGTPCVFLPHWQQYKSHIKRLINTRNAVGVNNMSTVKVLKAERSCYMAEVTGSKGKLVVRIGTSTDVPEGYTDADIVASGTMHCVWTKTYVNNDGIEDDPVVMPAKLYVMGNLASGSWKTNGGIEMTRQGDTFTADGVEFVASSSTSKDTYFSFVTTQASGPSDWTTVNKSDRYGAISNNAPLKVNTPTPFQVGSGDAYAWKFTPGKYDIVADFKTMTITVKEHSGVTDVTVSDEDATPVYYNLQGARVENPGTGVYIVVRGKRASKEYIR